jgi:hypothetical protein
MTERPIGTLPETAESHGDRFAVDAAEIRACIRQLCPQAALSDELA